MDDLKLIENKIAQIREKIGVELFEEENGKYKKLEELQAEINKLRNYICKGYEEWPNQIINLLDYLRELIKKEISKTKNSEKIKNLEKWEYKIVGITEGIKREILNIPDILIDRLKKDGFNISKNKLLSDAINNIGFRLLEKVRLGQRDEVFYMLLRVFAANNEKIPVSLIDAIKTKYEDTLFKSFIYSFLAPILGTKELEGGEE